MTQLISNNYFNSNNLNEIADLLRESHIKLNIQFVYTLYSKHFDVSSFIPNLLTVVTQNLSHHAALRLGILFNRLIKDESYTSFK
jgi:hypothetical protein